MAHTTATALVTSRWPKRNAAHTISGTMRKVGANPALNTRWAAPTRTMANSASSTSLRAVHATLLRANQLRISGAKVSTPLASPCHHVDQLLTRSSSGIW